MLGLNDNIWVTSGFENCISSSVEETLGLRETVVLDTGVPLLTDY